METHHHKTPADFNAGSLTDNEVSKDAYRSILARFFGFFASLDITLCKVDQFIF